MPRKRSAGRDSRGEKVASAEDGVDGGEVVEEAVAGQNVVVSDHTTSVPQTQVGLVSHNCAAYACSAWRRRSGPASNDWQQRCLIRP